MAAFFLEEMVRFTIKREKMNGTDRLTSFVQKVFLVTRLLVPSRYKRAVNSLIAEV